MSTKKLFYLINIIFMLFIAINSNAQFNRLWVDEFDARDILTSDAPIVRCAVNIETNWICRYDTTDISDLYIFNEPLIITDIPCIHKWIESELNFMDFIFTDVCEYHLSVKRRICSKCFLHQELFIKCEKPILTRATYQSYLQNLKK